MVMKIGCEVEQNLVVTIVYDDGISKTVKVSEGDFVKMVYNYNGTKRCVTGTVTTIHANPYNGQLSRKDWYVVVANSDYSPGAVPSVRINIVNILDLELIHSVHDGDNVKTPSTSMRVTDIRVKDNYLQISQNWGETWLTVGVNPDGSLSPDPVGDDKTVKEEIEAMIGSDQYAGSDEFINGVIEIINTEVEKRLHCHCRVGRREDNTSSIIEEG